jgi:acyl carrier protein
MQSTTHDEILEAIRGEIAKYVDRSFGNEDDFVVDMCLHSDDLSAVALSLERKLGIKIDRKQYRSINNIDQYTALVQEALSCK